jgi:hypothetical protein
MGDVARSRVPRFTLLFTAPAARTLEAERMICADDGRLCALSKPRASVGRQATRVEVCRQPLAGCAEAKDMHQRHDFFFLQSDTMARRTGTKVLRAWPLLAVTCLAAIAPHR